MSFLDEWKKDVEPEYLDGTLCVVGVTFGNHQDVLSKLLNLYNDEIVLPVRLVPEDNEYDPNAVRVEIAAENDYVKIGYVSKDIAETVRLIIPALIECRVESMGRQGATGNIGVTLYYKVKND